MHAPVPEEKRISTRDMAFWVFVWVLGLVALVMGCIGFRIHGEMHHEHVSLAGAVYASMQMFVLHTPHLAEPVPWELEFARFAAAFVGLYTATRTLMVILARQLQAMLLRVIWGHVVVCGLGRKGLELARSCRKAGRRVVVVDKQEDNELLEAARAAGARVVIADSTQKDVLRSVGAHRARWLIASTGDDGQNIEIAVHAWELVREQRLPALGRMRCFVHLVNPDLREELKNHPVLTDSTDRMDTRPFNIYESGARMLFEKHPLDYETIGPNDRRPVHLVILGLGQMGEAVLIQAARIAHFAHGLKLRVTVVDRDVDKRQRLLLNRFPQLEKVCDLIFIPGDAEDPGTVQQLAHLCRVGDSIPYVAICFDDDSHSITCALRLRKSLACPDMPMVVRMAADAGLATLLHEKVKGKNSSISRLMPFGMVDQVCTRDMLADEELDRLARRVHEDYRAHRRQQGNVPADDPSMADWEQLDDGLKESNRQQADHVPVKLRAIRLDLGKYKASPRPFSDEEIELLARMEHARWNAERFLAGWTLNPKDAKRKQSPYLVEWEKVPAEIQEYDRAAVRNIERLFGNGE